MCRLGQATQERTAMDGGNTVIAGANDSRPNTRANLDQSICNTIDMMGPRCPESEVTEISYRCIACPILRPVQAAFIFLDGDYAIADADSAALDHAGTEPSDTAHGVEAAGTQRLFHP